MHLLASRNICHQNSKKFDRIYRPEWLLVHRLIPAMKYLLVHNRTDELVVSVDQCPTLPLPRNWVLVPTRYREIKITVVGASSKDILRGKKKMFHVHPLDPCPSFLDLVRRCRVHGIVVSFQWHMQFQNYYPVHHGIIFEQHSDTGPKNNRIHGRDRSLTNRSEKERSDIGKLMISLEYLQISLHSYLQSQTTTTTNINMFHKNNAPHIKRTFALHSEHLGKKGSKKEEKGKNGQ